MPSFVESLEPRRLLAVAYPSPLEQYVVELLNRARANPAAEAARFGIDLNEGLSPGSISSAARQPLAPNPFLTSAARNHSQWMIDTDTFSHTGAGGSDPGDRMDSAGYDFTGSWTWGENIAWRSFSTRSATAALLAQIHKDLFVDSGITGRGHRKNILNASFRELGPGFVSGNFKGFKAGMLTEDFATSGSTVFLTGVAYNDAVLDDDFYTPGEGLGSVTISARRLSDDRLFATTTWASGGYSLALPAGTYQLTASGGAFSTPVTLSSVTIGSQNVKRDFLPNNAPPLPADVVRPTGTLTSAPKQTVAGAKYYPFTVTYTDNVSLNVSTFDNYDILITDPHGVRRYGALSQITPAGNGSPRTVTYLMKAPGARFDPSDNGVYTISLRKQQVSDTGGNKNAGKVLGQFSVAINATNNANTIARPKAPGEPVRQKGDAPIFA